MIKQQSKITTMIPPNDVNNSKRKTHLPSLTGFSRMQSRETYNKPNPTSNTPTVDHKKALELITVMQERMFDRVKKNEARYTDALNKIYTDMYAMKKKTNFIKVENGQTTEEYLQYRARMDKIDRKKRLDALTLLNRFGESITQNNYSVDFHFHDYPNRKYAGYKSENRLYPLRF